MHSGHRQESRHEVPTWMLVVCVIIVIALMAVLAQGIWQANTTAANQPPEGDGVVSGESSS